MKDLLAYFFFSSDSGTRGDPFIIIRSLVSQLISRDVNAYQLAFEKWELSEGLTVSRTETMELFRFIAQNISYCTFIVDGLDECAWRAEWKSADDHGAKGFLTSLKQAIAHTTSRVLILSRGESDIRSGIVDMLASDSIQTLYQHSISPRDVRADIEFIIQEYRG
jgi:hypothetical protein